MSFIKKEVRKLEKRFKINDPFLLAEKLNIITITRCMHEEINGFFKKEQRNRFIVINKNLSSVMQRFVCAHELGHAILHPDINTPFFRKHTLFTVDKIEMEANSFAVELLVPDETIKEHDGITLKEAAAIYGVPTRLMHLKKYK